MNTIALNLIMIFVAIAFVATLISGLIKLVFFLKQKNSYRLILKFALLGEAAGLLFMFMAWLLFRREISNWQEPESIIAIPFYAMLAGQIAGFIVIFRSKRKQTAC